MGALFDRAQRIRARDAAKIDSAKHTSNLLLAGVMGIFGVGLTVAALVNLAVVALLGGLVALASPYCWMRGDRARVDEISPEHRNAYAAELGWSLLAVALLLGGFALFVAALAGGWR